MNYIGKSLRIAAYQFRNLIATPRIPVILLMVAVFIMENLRAIAGFCEAVGIPATPYAFPHLTNDFRCQVVLMAAGILLFCDAPFEDDGHMYVLPRAGKLPWACGQVIYIAGLALFYIFFIFLFSILPLIGHLELGAEWGKIWGTLAKTDAGVSFSVPLIVTEYMVSNYSPISALLISLGLEWAVVTWLGLLVYFFNKLTERPFGTFLGAFCILLDICIANDWTPWANKFSPITLAQINSYTGYNLQHNITFIYGSVFFIVGIIVLILLGIVANYKLKIYYDLLKYWRNVRGNRYE